MMSFWGPKAYARALLWSSAALLPMAIAAGPAAAAVQDRPPTRIRLDIPSQDLGTALSEFARQSHQQLLYSPEIVRGKKSSAVSGDFSARQGLEQLLAGSGIRVATDSSGAFLLSSGGPEGNAGAAGTAAQNGAATGAPTGPAQASEITVIGTRLKGVPKDGPQEVRSYSHEQIEASGQPSIARFLNTLPEVSQMSFSPFNLGSTDSVQLRGFPVGTTLVLLDGHRAPASGFSDDSFDINNIPEGLLERVDILPLGSSAIYGSDALAGVVNFVLNRHLQGLSVEASDGQASHYSDRAATFTVGRKFARGDLGFGVSYEDHSDLMFADRSFLASGDFSRFAGLGGRDQRSTFCQPGTVFALSGNLPGLDAPFAAIPAGLTGVPSISDFADGANTQNLCNPLAKLDLSPATKRWSGLGYADLDVTDHLHFYATALGGRLKNDILVGSPIVGSVVGASNPFNPFGTPVLVTAALPVEQTDHITTQFQHLEVGLRGDLPAGWTFDLNGHATRDRDRAVDPEVIFFPNLSAALASSDPATAIDLFAPTIPTPIATSILKTLSSDFADRSQVVEAVFRGPLFQLPGGPIQMAFGASYEQQRLNSDSKTAFDPAGNLFERTAFGSRHIGSGFAELRAPLLASFQGGEKPALALSAAVRRDQFSDFGSATKPQFGLEFRPFGSLLFRAASSQAFRAPTLSDLHRSPQTLLSFIQDPEHGGAFVLVPTTEGGNPNLRPETGRSSSFGLVWTPEGRSGATVSATYWKILEHDRITTPSGQALVDDETAFPGRVIRDPAGNLVSIDATFVNFGDLRAEGIDFDATDRFHTRLGEFTPSLSVTVTTKFEGAFQPGGPLEDRLGKPVLGDVWAPRLKANASLGWHRGPFSVSGAMRYLGRYRDYQDFGPNSNRLGGYALWDASANLVLGDLLGLKTPGLKRTELSISAVNLFDRGPQFSNSGLGYDPEQFDILGRFVTARLRLAW